MELKTNYAISDSELVYLINENNGDAKDYLYDKYSPLIHKEINKVKKTAYALGIDMADLSQEAMLGFSTAINSYNETEDVKFITFATICIRRKLLNYIEKHSTNKNRTFNASLALDSSMGDADSTLLNFLKDSEGKIPLNKLLNEEALKELGKSIDEKLSKNEKMAIQYLLFGLDVDNIAIKMNKTSKQIYNLIYRARQKLKEDE